MQRWNHSQEQASMKNKTSCWIRLWLDASKISVNLCWICLYWFCCLNSNRCQKFKQSILEKKTDYSGYFIQTKILEAGFLFEPGKGHFFQSVGQLELSKPITLAETTAKGGLESYMWQEEPVLQRRPITTSGAVQGRRKSKPKGAEQLKEAPYEVYASWLRAGFPSNWGDKANIFIWNLHFVYSQILDIPKEKSQSSHPVTHRSHSKLSLKPQNRGVTTHAMSTTSHQFNKNLFSDPWESMKSSQSSILVWSTQKFLPLNLN